MSKLQIFNNPEFGQVRCVEVDGKPYAVGMDVARALGYAKPSQAVIDHCKGIRKLGIPSDGGIQETNIIPEGDIYRLIVKAADQSKNKEVQAKAEKFERWVFDEVIPAIRKTGSYELPADKSALAVARTLLVAVEAQSGRIDTVEDRVDTLETTVQKEVLVNSRQAATIQRAIATRIRDLLPEDYKTRSKQYFSWMYREIYARFAVPSYRDIPRVEFNAVLALIKEWSPVQAAREAS